MSVIILLPFTAKCEATKAVPLAEGRGMSACWLCALVTCRPRICPSSSRHLVCLLSESLWLMETGFGSSWNAEMLNYTRLGATLEGRLLGLVCSQEGSQLFPKPGQVGRKHSKHPYGYPYGCKLRPVETCTVLYRWVSRYGSGWQRSRMENWEPIKLCLRSPCVPSWFCRDSVPQTASRFPEHTTPPCW